jgi:uncharacterized membrane-anchored protein YhcB (DUF1043 family)
MGKAVWESIPKEFKPHFKSIHETISARCIDRIQEDYPDRYVGLAAHSKELLGEEWTLEDYIMVQLIWNEALRDWERFFVDSYIEMLLHVERRPYKVFIPQIQMF